VAFDPYRHHCKGMDAWISDEEIPISYEKEFREYYVGIPNSESYVVFNFCPYCGAELPDRLRNEWFDRIFELELDGPEDPRIPEEMRSDAWWAEHRPDA
jgi:hypothetical protein